MLGEEDGIFFSTKPNGEIKGYGEVVLEARIPVEKLLLDDEFKDELHFRVKVKVGERIKVRVRYF